MGMCRIFDCICSSYDTYIPRCVWQNTSLYSPNLSPCNLFDFSLRDVACVFDTTPTSTKFRIRPSPLSGTYQTKAYDNVGRNGNNFRKNGVMRFFS